MVIVSETVLMFIILDLKKVYILIMIVKMLCLWKEASTKCYLEHSRWVVETFCEREGFCWCERSCVILTVFPCWLRSVIDVSILLMKLLTTDVQHESAKLSVFPEIDWHRYFVCGKRQLNVTLLDLFCDFFLQDCCIVCVQ